MKSWSKAWSESRFKQEFLQMEVPAKMKIDIDFAPEAMGKPIGNFGRMGFDHATLAPKMTLKGPVSLVYDRFSRRAKSSLKLQKLQQAEIKRKHYQQKMDTIWISRITDLSGKQLESFIKFCQLPESFVLEANEYELIVAIHKRLKEFLSLNN